MEVIEKKERTEVVKTKEGIPPEATRVDGGNVYLYSADNLMKRGERRGDVNYVVIDIPDGSEIRMLGVLSPGHTPMDAVAVFVSNDGKEIRWAKSDGVTNVGVQDSDNNSGKLADKLVRNIAIPDLLDDPVYYTNRTESEMRMKGAGAATVEYGKIVEGTTGWEVEVFKIGSTEKTRLVETVSNNVGDSGVLDTKYDNESINGHHGFWEVSTKREFVGVNSGEKGRLETKNFFSGEGLTIVSATDGVKAKINGEYANSGIAMDIWLRDQTSGDSVSTIVDKARSANRLSSGDDISMVSIHLAPRIQK